MLLLNLDPTWKFDPQGQNYFPINKKQFVFSGGEVHIKLEDNFKFQYPQDILIAHRINNSQNLMELLMAADAVRRNYPDFKINALIPYLPYARQDRPMVTGEPFSLKVFAEILKTARFNKVYTLDPHSDVASALIDNLAVVAPNYLIKTKEDIIKNYGEFVLVSPDGGALKKIYNHAKFINYNGGIICATKHRDVSNGKILSTTIDEREVGIGENRTVWIQDDICDGGATFIELAKVLRKHGAKRVLLSVSHGIFSKGETELKEVLDKIYTTDSIKNDESELIKRFSI